MGANWNQFDSGLSNPLRQKLDALRQSWGRDFNLNSGYRDPRYNFLVGGAKGSQHIDGNAADIDTSTWTVDDRKRFLDVASKLGFGGLGVYDNALHLDVGPRRAWGKDHTSTTIPAWSRSVIDPHLQPVSQTGPAKPIAERQPQAQPDLGDYGSADERSSGNAFDRPQRSPQQSPESGVYGFGRSVAPDEKKAATQWGSDHYGGFIDWGSGGRSYT